MTRHTFGLAPRKPLRLIARNPVYQLYAKKPMPASLQATQAIDVRLSYANAISGDATKDDRGALAGMAKCVMVLAEKHCIAADLEAAQAAQIALLRADGRAKKGKTAICAVAAEACAKVWTLTTAPWKWRHPCTWNCPPGPASIRTHKVKGPSSLCWSA